MSAVLDQPIIRIRPRATPEDLWAIPDALTPEDKEILSSCISVVNGTATALAMLDQNQQLQQEYVEQFEYVMRQGMAKVSDQGAQRLAPIWSTLLDQLGALQHAQINPFAIAQFWSQQFDHYTDVEFARLARTEAAFAHNTTALHALHTDYEADSSVVEKFGMPPIHPNCMCVLAPMSIGDRVFVYLDTQMEACSICNALADEILAAIEAQGSVSGAPVGEPEATAPTTETPQGVPKFGSVAEANKWLHSRYPNIKFYLTDVQVTHLQEFAGELDRLFQLHPQGMKRLWYVGVEKPEMVKANCRSGSAYAYATRTGQMIFNAKYFKSWSKCRQHLEADIKSGFHPEGSEDPRSVITHEFGHIVAFAAIDRRIKQLTDAGWTVDDARTEVNHVFHELCKNKNLWTTSRYAHKDDDEAFAESFTAYYWRTKTSGEKLQPVYDAMGDILADEDFAVWEELATEGA